MKSFYDVVIIGAGAAGLFCAAQAVRRGRRVLLLEHNAKPGAKILVSGGGRCNFTNLAASPENFLSANPHFCKSALSRYTSHHFLELVEKHGIAFVEKKPGQLFCRDSAKDILRLLLNGSVALGATLLLETKVLSIQKSGGKSGSFLIHTNRPTYEDITAETVVVATGGLSLPQIGASGFGYEIARQFGMKIVPTAPALDGFGGDPAFQKAWKPYSGISTPVRIIVKSKSFTPKTFTEDLLITHQGLSGPAALQASLYWERDQPIQIDWCPGVTLSQCLLEKKLAGERKTLKNFMSAFWPQRLAEHLAHLMRFPDKPLNEISNQDLSHLAQEIHSWSWVPARTVGYARAEVTRGGVDTECFSSKTMESRSISGLFFIGEVLDVTGELGGYNFQWAWSSGWAAGQEC